MNAGATLGLMLCAMAMTPEVRAERERQPKGQQAVKQHRDPNSGRTRRQVREARRQRRHR